MASWGRVNRVHLELTNRCILRCVHCPVKKMQRAKRNMSFSLVKKIVEENPGIHSYGLSNWGEPLLYPRLFDVIEFLKEKHKRVGFATNAVLLDKETTRILLELKVDRIKFSLDAIGHDYEKIRGYNYQAVKTNILNFLHLRKSACMHATMPNIVCTLFGQDVKPLIREWKNVLPISFQPKVYFSSPHELRECRELTDNHYVILSNGEVVPCCADYEGWLSIGNAEKNSLEELLVNPKMMIPEVECGYCHEFKTGLAAPRFKISKWKKRLERLKQKCIRAIT